MTSAERKRVEEARAQIESELPELKAKAHAVKAARDAARDLLERLKRERVEHQMSLSDVAQASGIGREAICKLGKTPPMPIPRC